MFANGIFFKKERVLYFFSNFEIGEKRKEYCDNEKCDKVCVKRYAIVCFKSEHSFYICKSVCCFFNSKKCPAYYHNEKCNNIAS